MARTRTPRPKPGTRTRASFCGSTIRSISVTRLRTIVNATTDTMRCGVVTTAPARPSDRWRRRFRGRRTRHGCLARGERRRRPRGARVRAPARQRDREPRADARRRLSASAGTAWFAAAAPLFTVFIYGVAETLASRFSKQEEYIDATPAVAILAFFLAVRCTRFTRCRACSRRLRSSCR